MTPSASQLDEARDRHARACLSVHERYPLLGLARAFHQNRRGQPISFLDKPSLIPLYTGVLDWHEASFCKAVQTGISELLILLLLYNAGWRNRICAYVLPQYKTSARFVDERVNPLLVEVPAYAARTPGEEFGTKATQSKGNLERKRFGRLGTLLFLGAQTGSDFVEFSADTIVIDEFDKCIATKEGKTNVAKVPDRVQESACPQIFRIANPEFSGEGIHKVWKDGNRSKWFHRCVRCSERQALVWEEHFVRKHDDGRWFPRDTERAGSSALGDIRPVCRRCKRPFDREAQGGIWVAEDPARTPSFHMSRLDIMATVDRPQPMRAMYTEWVSVQFSTARLSAFYTGRLGWPYEVAGSRITVEMMEAVMVGRPPMDGIGGDAYKEKIVTMGVDVGNMLNVKISVNTPTDDSSDGWRRDGVFICAVSQFDELIRLIDRYRVQACVIDAMPETRKAKELRDHYIDEGTCDVWLCQFHPTARVGRDAFGLRMDYNQKVITVDRTQVMDTTMDDIAHGRATLPSDAGTVPGFMDQMKAPVRTFDQDANRVVWKEGNDPDHYRMADVYDRVALEIADRAGGFFEG